MKRDDEPAKSPKQPIKPPFVFKPGAVIKVWEMAGIAKAKPAAPPAGHAAGAPAGQRTGTPEGTEDDDRNASGSTGERKPDGNGNTGT